VPTNEELIAIMKNASKKEPVVGKVEFSPPNSAPAVTSYDARPITGKTITISTDNSVMVLEELRKQTGLLIELRRILIGESV